MTKKRNCISVYIFTCNNSKKRKVINLNSICKSVLLKWNLLKSSEFSSGLLCPLLVTVLVCCKANWFLLCNKCKTQDFLRTRAPPRILIFIQHHGAVFIITFHPIWRYFQNWDAIFFFFQLRNIGFPLKIKNFAVSSLMSGDCGSELTALESLTHMLLVNQV